ncbi:MAG: hypothetical protein A2017_12735 [Lentisphaerae bacterium GWF2_44_16]|nr:MAG: hypothetical protein A2017_12735 [Lentisphaerae bacterium GWF2_44_16]
MPFESGSFTLSIFRMPEKLPENYLELFASNNAGTLDSVKDEPISGWVSGRYLLETRIDEETAISGGHLYLNLRTAERKIPSMLLKAICRREELAYIQANKAISVPSKIRREIKEEAVEKNLMKMPPTISAVSFVIDMASGLLYLGTGSTAQIDNFLGCFHKTTQLEPLQLNIEDMMERLFKGRESDLPTLTFSADAGKDEGPAPGRDFLTWLWYYSEKEGGSVKLDKYGEFEMMIEGPLTFAFSEEAKGSAETNLKKGNPLRSAEAKAALNVGKRLKKAKITIVRGEEIWTCSFDADKFVFGGVSLPDGEEMEPDSRFAERINYLHIFQLVIQEYFRTFVAATKDSELQALEKKIQKWAKERDSY